MLVCSLSFQGGALGASQDQVYEAMEIFGEGIQDFDLFKDVDGEDEVSQWVMTSWHRHGTEVAVW